jgi:3'-5' exonuclease
MIHGIAAPGLACRAYYHRFTEDAVDLCDVLSSYSPCAKAKLHEISRIMGLDGKPAGMTGADLETHFREGRIKEIADYCRSDVINTYRLWLRYCFVGS